MILVLGALRRPLTVFVAVLGLLVASFLALRDAPVDILPDLDVPVIWVVQPYAGMSPEQMDGQFVHYYEYHFLYINGIEHVEAQSLQGMGVLKLFFHPGTDRAAAMAQVTAMTYRASSFMPPGTLPPFVVQFGAGNIPVAQLTFSSETRDESEIQDQALNRVRPMLATLPGVSAPPPSGGKTPIQVVELDPRRLRAAGLTPEDVASTLAASNLTLPAGNVRIGDVTTIARTNGMIGDVASLGDLPLREGPDATVFLRDVANVGRGTDVVTNVVTVDGRKTVYMPVTKRADASTLAVVREVRRALPAMRDLVPDDVNVELVFDQSKLVVHAVEALVWEGILGAGLTALMVLLFLRDPRSALIIAITIPLSVLSAIVILRIAGQTMNLMTLGGLALAVGILVDESTVAIENIHAHLGRGRPVQVAVRDAMAEVAVPRILALVCVVSVFVPAFFMVGVGRSLFPPLALAVGAAMASSYVISSTLVPVLAAWWMRPGAHAHAPSRAAGLYRSLLQRITARPRAVLLAYGAVCLPILLLAPLLPTRLFPLADSGELVLRVRAPDGTRLERTVEVVRAVEQALRDEAGAEHVGMVLANIGPPPWNVPVNAQFNSNTGPHEATLLVAMEGRGRPRVSDLVPRLRARLTDDMPEVKVAFEAGDIVSQIMDFGAAAPVEITVSASTVADARATARQIRERLAGAPGLRDVLVPHALDYPTLEIDLDRERIARLGLSTRQVARSVVAATSSSMLTTPLYWVDPAKGVPYRIAVRVPEHELASATDVASLPVGAGAPPVLLGQVARLDRGVTPGELNRYNGRKTVSVLAWPAGEDVGAAAASVRRALLGLELPRGVTYAVRGQVAQMESTLGSLREGLVLTVIVVFLLLTANFQSARIAASVLAVVPSVLAGVVVALVLTGTSVNIQSMMGAVMSIGVSVANSVLLVTFAVDRWRAGVEPIEAVVESGLARARPILMTGFAMMGGLLPTALALAEGGEQSAPLGRAVIGGLAGSLIGTLIVLPAALAWLRARGAVPWRLLPDETPVDGEAR